MTPYLVQILVLFTKLFYILNDAFKWFCVQIWQNLSYASYQL